MQRFRQSLAYDSLLAWEWDGEKDADWDRDVAYRDLKGNPYETPVWRIIAHLVNHDSYHRGQVVTMLRQLGHAPPGTDLILYYRTLGL